MSRILVASGLVVTSLIASACGIDTAALLEEEAEESPSSLRSFSTDLKTAQGMEYQVTFGVSPISIVREDLAPNQSVVTVTLKAELGMVPEVEDPSISPAGHARLDGAECGGSLADKSLAPDT